ncbi:MAG: TraR/DksA family transcriptional regulator [Alphaproteobacteria bacterium]|nr:TraR/DksA family transcriptional regulator [Alphaproteobacteria bacterium]MCB9796082.1 TraR/DksA family transcriptional regulator [Alphaproteobacteria bacterium]
MPDAARDRLLRQLDDVLGRHAKVDAHLQNLDRDLPQDWADRAQLLENDEVLEALSDHSRRQIEGIRAALERVDAGTYGACAQCGDAIDARRLETLPATPFCGECAKEH